MLNFKNILVKQNLKIICLYDMLRARTFRARRKSLLERYAHAWELARTFPRFELHQS